MKSVASFIVVVILMFILSGCVPEAKPVTVYQPDINKITHAEVGENMFEKTYALYQYKEAVQIIDEELDKNYYNKMYTQYDTDRQKYFTKSETNECIMINKVGWVYLIDKNCDGWFTDTDRNKLKYPIQYKIVKAKPISVLQDSFKYVVLYQGKVDNKLNITFQEFVSVNGVFMVRNAYTQNIQYELDKNGQATIGFKGLRIQVLKATNFDITYQIILN